jgi:hypothetical protein
MLVNQLRTLLPHSDPLRESLKDALKEEIILIKNIVCRSKVLKGIIVWILG